MKLEALRMLARLELEPARARFLSAFIDTYLRLNPEEALLFQAQADRVLDRTEKSKVMELTTSWKEEGLREGHQEGLREGRQEGLREGRQEGLQMTLRQLRRRCGALPPALESKVSVLSPRRIADLAEALLDFSGQADLERWLEQR